MDYNSLPAFYAALDAKYNVTNNDLNSATYTNVDCNFVYSAKYARHRWFNYKEGFSPILVEKIFNEYKLINLLLFAIHSAELELLLQWQRPKG